MSARTRKYYKRGSRKGPPGEGDVKDGSSTASSDAIAETTDEVVMINSPIVEKIGEVDLGVDKPPSIHLEESEGFQELWNFAVKASELSEKNSRSLSVI
jgi:hypothetical protein